MDTLWHKNGTMLSTDVTNAKMVERRAHRTVRNVTIILDLILINLGFLLAYFARYEWQWLREVDVQYNHSYQLYAWQQLLLNLFLIVAFSQSGAWQRRRGETWLDEVYRIVHAMAWSFTLLMAYQFAFRPEANSRIMIFWAAVFIGGFLSVSRLCRRWLLRYYYAKGRGVDRVLIVGSGETGRGVIRTLMARPDLGYKAIGYLDDGVHQIGSKRVPHLGSYSDLPRILKENWFHSVFIAMPADQHQEILHATKICLEQEIHTQVVPDLFQLSLGHVEMDNMAGIPILGFREVYTNPITQFIKRLVDLAVVGIFAIPALLIGGLIVLAIKLDDGGPIFYRAKRIGKGGREFTMYKFRSMVMEADALRNKLWQQNDADGPIFKIKNDPRITRVGHLIRKTSFDELPQFINILLGDMSIVGPRPPIKDEVDQYKEWHHRRLEVKGGLTGLWQVSGRSDLTFDEQCLRDIYYMENWSLALDLRIVLQTIPYVLLRRGAY